MFEVLYLAWNTEQNLVENSCNTFSSYYMSPCCKVPIKSWLFTEKCPHCALTVFQKITADTSISEKQIRSDSK